MFAPACQRLLTLHVECAQAGQVGILTIKCRLMSPDETLIARASDPVVFYHEVHVQLLVQ